MLFSARPMSGMGASRMPSLPRHFPQWSKTAILTISNSIEEENEEVKKSPPEPNGSGFIINSADAAARVAHLEHSVRFLQEQHRLMLSGLHAEIEALRERNRDLQFQLIFNKEGSPKVATTTPVSEDRGDSSEKEANLKREVSRLEREAAAARGEARAAEARALQLQTLVDAQAEKLRELDLKKCSSCQSEPQPERPSEAEESRGELRARLAEAERLVRRLRGDAERQRRELQCMKNSLHASLRASGMDGAYGYQNNYHFPPVHTPDFWREPLREDYTIVGRLGSRRPLTLPELNGQQIHRSTVYANNHTRPRANGYEHKKKPQPNGEAAIMKSPEEPTLTRITTTCTNEPKLPDRRKIDRMPIYPELRVVVTKMIPHEKASTSEARRPRKHHHRKHAPDHT
ncbi:coiled-coil domain-containing protein 74A-like isoform X2 [Plodia interpunctella]|uniref:coiled-coil domain-containing protein 74A-like isoform X2 n=1 Tax=Plodia interpunctella TaxID=58824 RepID=UPI0023687C6C|nr:coiled-coil domain-containing protein 74A-like isoform X2 [Plodia interpunctella]